MRGIVFIAIFVSALLPTAAQAQMRDAFGGHSGGMRGGFVGRGPAVSRGMPTGAFRGGFPARSIGGQRGFAGVRGTFRFNNFGLCNGFGRCFGQRFLRGGFVHRHNRFFVGFGGGFPFFNSWSVAWPYYGLGDPFYYGGYANYSAQSDYDVAERQRLLNDLEGERRRTDELRDEVADLREEATAPARTTRPSGAGSAEQTASPIVLVFRDSTRVEVQNYAIVGNTLYELGQHWTRKVAISDLDLPATSKANEERGIEFQMPPKARSR